MSLVFHGGRRPSPLCPVAGVSERVDVDHGQLVGRGLHDVAVESGPARARPNRWAGRALVTPVVARPARRRERGSVFTRARPSWPSFTRAKPSWPSSACEPPVRSEPAPAGDLRRYAMSRMSPPHAGHASGNASAIRASRLSHASREVSWERVDAIAAAFRSALCADGAVEAPSPRPSPGGRGGFPALPIARAVTAARSG